MWSVNWYSDTVCVISHDGVMKACVRLPLLLVVQLCYIRGGFQFRNEQRPFSPAVPKTSRMRSLLNPLAPEFPFKL